MTSQELINYTYLARLGWTKVDGDGNAQVDAGCKFPLASVTAAIEEALAAFNDEVPKKKFFRHDFTQDGPPYGQFGLPTDAGSVLGVYWRFEATVDAALLGSNLELFPSSPYSHATDLLEVLINTYQMDAIGEYLRTQGVDYEFISSNSLHVLSQSTIKTVWVLHTYDRTLADLPSKYKVWFSYKVAEIAIRGYVINKERSQGFQRAGGLVEFGGGASLEEIAVKYKEEWDKKMMGFSKLAMIGNVE